MAELGFQLRLEDCRVQVVRSGPIDPASPAPVLVLLDIADPEQDPLAAYRSLPPPRSAPLVLMTAAYTEEIVAEALEAGVDCCLPATVSHRELAAWVRALLRRRASPVPRRTAPFTLGPLTIDLARGRVEKHGVPLTMPPTQLLILRALAERPGRVVPREHLLTQVLGPQPRKMSTLHVHIFLLRSLIEDDPRRPRYLKTIRGVGYILTDDYSGLEEPVDRTEQE
jgi:DNA-binding response OmpR family regulator